MFPQNWSPVKVVEKTLEAYDNPQVKKYSTCGNKYLVCGKTNEGMYILWVFEVIDKQPTEKNISVYPVEKLKN